MDAGHPTKPCVIYDDACGFCRRWADRLRRWDRAGRIVMLPLQDDRAPALAGRPRNTLRQAVHVVLPTGRVAAGAAALGEVCRFLPGGWVVRLVLAPPGALSVAEWGYRYVARRWGPVGSRSGPR
jgi:predicted DCC family thiol-disulfide oxidoreductase YuxK